MVFEEGREKKLQLKSDVDKRKRSPRKGGKPTKQQKWGGWTAWRKTNNTTVRYQHLKPATMKVIFLPFPLFSPAYNDSGDPCQVQGPGSDHGAPQGHQRGNKLHRDASCQRISWARKTQRAFRHPMAPSGTRPGPAPMVRALLEIVDTPALTLQRYRRGCKAMAVTREGGRGIWRPWRQVLGGRTHHRFPGLCSSSRHAGPIFWSSPGRNGVCGHGNRCGAKVYCAREKSASESFFRTSVTVLGDWLLNGLAGCAPHLPPDLKHLIYAYLLLCLHSGIIYI